MKISTKAIYRIKDSDSGLSVEFENVQSAIATEKAVEVIIDAIIAEKPNTPIDIQWQQYKSGGASIKISTKNISPKTIKYEDIVESLVAAEFIKKIVTD